jgi:C1A family cysteine protease
MERTLRSRITVCLLILFFLFSFALVSAAPSQGITGGLSSMNPDFVRYLEEQKTTRINLNGIESNLLGYVPPPVDLSYLSGQQITRIHETSPLENNRTILLATLVDQQYSVIAATGSAQTSRFDLRNEGRVTTAKNQGQCGCCWAFSTLASLESSLLPSVMTDFSENNMKNSHGFDLLPCQGGNSFISTAYLSRWSGPLADANDPYSPSQSGSAVVTVPNSAALYHVQEVLYVPGRSGSLDNQNIKTMLVEKGAVYSSVHWEDFLYSPSTAAYYYSGSSAANHAVTIVGWDDAYDLNKFSSRPPGNGAFIVKNSWGPSWGENGYFYVSYYDRQIGRDNAVFIAEPVSNYYHIYQYDPLGWVASYEDVGDTAYFANIFTAQAEEDITAVAFYTPSLNAQYKILLYKGVGNTPVSGSALSSQSGSINIPGYHTITLSQPVRVKQGEKFSVVVKLTTPGNNYPVAIEYPYPGFSSRATARSGESYVSSNGVVWTDLTTQYSNSNVCLKAFSSRLGQTTQTQSTTPTSTPIQTPTPRDTSPPSVTMTSPVSYASVSPGQTISISWSASDNQAVASVTLQYSTNSGTTWNTIAENQPKSGTYPWVIPDTTASTLTIKITARDTSGNTGSQSRVCFVRKATVNPTGTLTPTPTRTPTPIPTPTPSGGDIVPPSVTISSPISYAAVTPGQALSISWSASDNQAVTSVTLQYSSNGGSNWNIIAENQPKSGTYTWAIPDTPASTLTIRITARDTSGNAGSQSRFLFLKKTVFGNTISHSAGQNLSGVSLSYSAQKGSRVADLIRESNLS